MEMFRGTGVAIITPFSEDKSIDYDGLENLIQHLSEGNVEYLVVLGTTGESATLTKQEKQDVLDFVKNNNPKGLPLVAGFGGNNTIEIVDQLISFDLDGYDAILSVSPYYNKPNQEGIYQHYKMISENSPLPIILYNVPGRTSSNVSASTTLRLANDFDNIIAVKEASGDLNQIQKIIKDRPEGFLVLSGDDNLTLSMLACGADGVISVIANSHPQTFSNMVRAALNGDMAIARDNHYKLFDLTNLIFEEGNPAGVKYVLKELEVIDNHLRLPLIPVSDGLAARIKELI